MACVWALYNVSTISVTALLDLLWADDTDTEVCYPELLNPKHLQMGLNNSILVSRLPHHRRGREMLQSTSCGLDKSLQIISLELGDRNFQLTRISSSLSLYGPEIGRM